MSGRPYSSGASSSGNSSYGEPYRRSEGYERGTRGRGGGYVREGGRGDYRGSSRGGFREDRGGYQSGYHGSYNSYNTYRDEHPRDSYSSPSAVQRHNSDSTKFVPEPKESENAVASHNSGATPDLKRNSIVEGESYNRSPSHDFKGGFRGGRGSYRGLYRGGYKPRDGYSPYRRESYTTQGTSTSNSRANSLNDSNSYHNSPEAHGQSPYRKDQDTTNYKSPWIELLKLNVPRENHEDALKVKELITEQEAIYEEQEKIDSQMKEQKIKNLKLEMEISVLRACAQKDALNVELTQEKLDTISFL